MLKTPLPAEVRNALLTRHIVLDDLLDVQLLLDEIEDLPNGARYFTLPPGSTNSDREPDELTPKEKFELLILCLECYVADALHGVNRQLAVLRRWYPDYEF